MHDDNWDLINGEDAHMIERLNRENQINLIKAYARFVLHHHGVGPKGCPKPVPIEALKELHRAGTLLLLKSPGEYREGFVGLYDQNDNLVYEPPKHDAVERHVEQFAEDLASRWEASHPISIASFCLWKINWIHPFYNGNGRTARAFSYACLLLKYGRLELPGKVTMIDLIMKTKPQFESALTAADESLAQTGSPDLRAMEAYVEGLVREQFASREA